MTCRSCGGDQLVPVLDLGSTPLANALLDAKDLDRPERRYPLRLVFCEACTLVQITETVPPEELFSEYLYFSSYSNTMLEHAGALAGRLIEAEHLDRDALVVEIASNDGYLLQFYRDAGIPVLGIEPARNVAAVATERGIETMNEFFGVPVAARLRAEGRFADVLHAHNVLAHVADLHGVVQGIADVLKPSGVAVIEVPFVGEMIENCEFDTIYHEHLAYYSLTAADRLIRGHGMEVSDVELLPIHGGSLRLFVSHQGRRPIAASVADLLATEAAKGMLTARWYADFGDRVDRVRGELADLLAELKSSGARIAAYGASAKGSTLLNSIGVGAETIDFVVDRSPFKQGRYTPGTHIPIGPPELLRERHPDYVLLLTWNFAAEILAQQEPYLRAGGRFVIPIPTPHVVAAEGAHAVR